MSRSVKLKNKLNKLEKELEAVDKIIETVYNSAAQGDFNLHILKGKENGLETLNEQRLASLDTKRILEAAAVLEKAVGIKKKILEDLSEFLPKEDEKKEAGIIILPPVKDFEPSLFGEGGEGCESV